MQTLFEIVAEYRDLIAKIADMELPPEVVIDTIESAQGDLEQKVRSVAAYIRNIESLADAREQEARRIQNSCDALRNRAESLRGYLQAQIGAAGMKLPLRYVEFDVNMAKMPPSVDVFDETKLPEQFVKKTASFEIGPTVQMHLKVSEDVEFYTFVVPVSAARIDKAPRKALILTELKAAKQVSGAKLNPTGYRLTIK